jgi:AcrR family transcriptional regulator
VQRDDVTTSIQYPTPQAQRKYAGASAEERKKQRRERLMDAGFDVFGREGYQGATMRMICAQAKLTERYFYEHFATPHDVFEAVHRRQSAIVAQQIMAARAQHPNGSLAGTRAGLVAFFSFIQADRRCAQILLADAITSGMANPLNMRAKVSSLAEMVREGIKQAHPGLRIDVDADMVIAGLVGMIIQTGAMWVGRDYDLSVEAVVDHNLYAWMGFDQWLRDNSGTE